MDTTPTHSLPDIKEPQAELAIILMNEGYSAEAAQQQIQELGEVILLSAIENLAKSKGIDIATCAPDTESQIQFVQERVTEDEFEQVIHEESLKQIQAFLDLAGK